MISRRSALLGILSVALTGAAQASPGMVDRNGCHSKPRHCHPASDISRNKKGRRYVQFGNDNGGRGRKKSK